MRSANKGKINRKHSFIIRPSLVLWWLVGTLLSGSLASLRAQGLNWEGQSGGLVTPFAYTSSSPAKGFGKPQVAFHYLNTGGVVGNNFTPKITIGLLKRLEFGYTRFATKQGNTPGLSPLFAGGFNIFHGKLNFFPENFAKQNYLPALAIGLVARTQVRHVGGVLQNKDASNGDVYLVATKTITQTKRVPVLLNLGVRATNASIWGIAGNAPAWQGRLFGAAAFVFSPFRQTLILGAEFAQQPRHIAGLPGPTIPTTLTYIVRFVPMREISRLSFDFGVVQAAGVIAPGVNVKARHQFGTGVSYQF